MLHAPDFFPEVFLLRQILQRLLIKRFKEKRSEVTFFFESLPEK